jgi:hypothetical protein
VHRHKKLGTGARHGDPAVSQLLQYAAIRPSHEVEPAAAAAAQVGSQLPRKSPDSGAELQSIVDTADSGPLEATCATLVVSLCIAACQPASSSELSSAVDCDSHQGLLPLADLPGSLSCRLPLHPSFALWLPEEAPKPLQTFDEKGVVVCPFIKKLWSMVRDPCSAGLICWSRDGQSLVVMDEYSMIICLQKHFRPGQFNSFVRQLNYHGFKKKSMAESSSPSSTCLCSNGNAEADRGIREFITFTPPFCLRGREDVLHLIVRNKKLAAGGKTVRDDPPLQLLRPDGPPMRREDETFADSGRINSLHEQVRQLIVQHKLLSRSQNSILYNLKKRRFTAMEELDSGSSLEACGAF